MFKDGRKLVAWSRKVAAGDVPETLVEGFLLSILGDSCAACGNALKRIEKMASQELVVSPLLAAWYDPDRIGHHLRVAQRQLVELQRCFDRESQFEYVGNTRAPLSPALVALLLAEARDASQDDPDESLHWAALAERAAAREPASDFPGCQALATAYVANALRTIGKLQEAAAHFEMVSQLPPPTSRWLQAEILSLEGSLLKDQRRLSAALNRLGQAYRGFRDAGSRNSVARVLINTAAVRRLDGDIDGAVATLRQALPELNPMLDPRLHLWAHHNLAVYLCEAGKPAAARELLALLKPLFERFPNRHPKLRVRWLEGLIAREDGELQTAEKALRSVLCAFADEGAALCAAMVALDLALILLGQGRFEELGELAGLLPPIFERAGVPDEAYAASMLFVRAATGRSLTRRLLVGLRSYFEHAQADPSAPFRDRIAR